METETTVEPLGKRMAIPVDEATHAFCKQLSDLTGIQMRDITAEALKLWAVKQRTTLRTSMERRLAELDKLAGIEAPPTVQNGRKRSK